MPCPLSNADNSASFAVVSASKVAQPTPAPVGKACVPAQGRTGIFLNTENRLLVALPGIAYCTDHSAVAALSVDFSGMPPNALKWWVSNCSPSATGWRALGSTVPGFTRDIDTDTGSSVYWPTLGIAVHWP